MNSCWVNCHVFLAQLDGHTYRCSPTLGNPVGEKIRWVLYA